MSSSRNWLEHEERPEHKAKRRSPVMSVVWGARSWRPRQPSPRAPACSHVISSSLFPRPGAGQPSFSCLGHQRSVAGEKMHRTALVLAIAPRATLQNISRLAWIGLVLHFFSLLIRPFKRTITVQLLVSIFASLRRRLAPRLAWSTTAPSTALRLLVARNDRRTERVAPGPPLSLITDTASLSKLDLTLSEASHGSHHPRSARRGGTCRGPRLRRARSK